MRLTFQIQFTWPKGPKPHHTTFLCPLVSLLSLYLYLYIIPLVLHNPHLKQTWLIVGLSWLNLLLFPTTPLYTRSSGHHSSCHCGHRRPTPSAQCPSQADLTHCLSVLVGFFVVPHYPLSMPVDVKFTIIVTQTILHNSQTSLLHDPDCVICHLLHLVCVHLLMCIWLTRACAAHRWVVSFVFFYAWYMFLYSCLQHLADMCLSILAETIAVPHHLCLPLSVPCTAHSVWHG